MRSTALASIPVGVVVERRRAKSRWAEFLWRPVSVLVGKPSAEPWIPLDPRADATLFYAGDATIELHRTETACYRDNLGSGAPKLWVTLRHTAAEPPYELLAVTADPAEGEAFTDAGSNLVEAVPMPPAIAEAVSQFVASHHVERPFVKRQRQPAEPAPENSISGGPRLKPVSVEQAPAGHEPANLARSARQTLDTSPAVDGDGLPDDRSAEGAAIKRDPHAEANGPPLNRRSHGGALPR